MKVIHTVSCALVFSIALTFLPCAAVSKSAVVTDNAAISESAVVSDNAAVSGGGVLSGGAAIASGGASCGARMSVSAHGPCRGVVNVCVGGVTDKRIRIGVEAVNSEKSYYFPVFRDEDDIEIPLMWGNDEYFISLYEEFRAGQYELLDYAIVDLCMEDYSDVYLASSVMAPWEGAEATAAKALELIADRESEYGRFLAIYHYIVDNIDYDAEKDPDDDYRSSPDDTLANGSGICLDYAVLTSAMLRGLGVKCKLIYGYVAESDVLHSWNEVYIRGRWIVVDTTRDARSRKLETPYNYTKSRNDYTVKYAF